MRILHLAHDHLEQAVAGIEVYTSRLLTLQRTTDEPGLVVARPDPSRPTGRFDTKTWLDVPCYEVVQNRDGWRFEQTWRDPRLAPAFRRIYEDFRPDLIHVQSLINLTLSAIDVACESGIPIVLTLHDHSFACAQGGQRFHVDRSRCDRLDAVRCARCTWAGVGPIPALRAAARRACPGPTAPGPTGASPPPTASARSLMRLRTALARHVPVSSEGGRIRRRWDAMRGLAERVALFIAPSQDMRRAALEFGFPPDRIQHLPHGIPRTVSPRARGIDDVALHFGYVGSLVPHKGVHHLITAFSDMPEGARLDVHGALDDAPEYVRELRARARHPGICFAGPLAPEAVPSAMVRFDCLVAPSIWRENAPLGVQEAFAAGTPVVASDLGGHRELLDGGGGLLFPPDEEAALAATLRRLATQPGLVSELAAKVRPPCRLEEHGDALRELYRRVLHSGSGSAIASTPHGL